MALSLCPLAISASVLVAFGKFGKTWTFKSKATLGTYGSLP